MTFIQRIRSIKLPRFIRFLVKLIRHTLKDMTNDNVLKLSAALSYYTVFSLPPLLIIIIKLSGAIYGQAAVEGKIFNQIRAFVGSDVALQIQQAIQHFHTAGDSFVTTVIGIVTLLLGATAVFGEIQHSVNLIWKIRAKPKRGLVKLLVNRLLSFSLIVTLCFLLVVTLTIDGVLEILSERLIEYLPEWSLGSLYLLNLLLMFVVLTLLFSTIFKVLPDARIHWKNVLIGAVVTTLLFMLGKSVLSWYLSNNISVSAYGAAGSIILLLLWVYYSAIILFVGAEFTQVYALMSGKRIHPNQYAVFIDTREIESLVSPLEKELQEPETAPDREK